MIEPFFFSDKKLFGVYHPASDAVSERCVVICPPIFDEYRRSYRAMVELAQAASEKGVHVLNFDYSGTGDSYLELSDIESVKCWVSDIDNAVDEMLNLTGVQKITLLGVRFGAILASQCSHQAIKKRIYWDPVVSGNEYYQWLRRVNEDIYEGYKKTSRYTGFQLESISYEQFSLSPKMIESIRSLNMNWREKTTRCLISFRPLLRVVPKKITLINEEQYNWPEYEDGLIQPRSVLENLLALILEKP